MFTQINNLINWLDAVVWGLPLIILILFTGCLLTIRLGVLQIRHLGKALKFMIKNEDGGEGEVSSFGALCTALSATIGTGNIVGVATAIAAGGPGALFWMVIAAFLGMATKYAEGLLAIKYRTIDNEGHVLGGPFYYIENGMGHGWRWLAKIFAFFGAGVGLFGIGTFTQVNGIASAVKNFFDPNMAHTVTLFGNTYSWATVIACLVLTLCVGLVVLGGIQRISKVAQIVVPFMAVLYVIGALVVCISHIGMFGEVFTAIFKGAFGMKAVGGGVLGYGINMAITWGFKRGAFSNEAGLGSSVMVHSNSNVKEPVRQGMWGIFEVFADTIVVCSLTAFAILSSGLVDLETGQMISENAGSGLVGEAFATVFGSIGPKFIAIAILLFAYSTVLGWSHYGSKAFEFLFGTKAMVVYKVVFIVVTFFGCTMSLSLAWDLSDTFNGLMMIPNLIGVLALSGTVAKITKNYVDRTFHGSKEEPMYSAFEDVQKAQMEASEEE